MLHPIVWEIVALALAVAVACTCLFLVGTRDSRLRDLREQLRSLEADRASVKLELQGLVEQCEEILARTESKRRRFAAQEHRERAESDATEDTRPATRADQLRIVRENLARRGIRV